MIYLDNASTTQVDLHAIHRIAKVMDECWGNPSNLYDFGQQSNKIILSSKEQIAQSLGCSSEEIYFVSCSSEGNAWALAQGSKCLCSAFEHHSITSNPKSIICSEDYLDKLSNVTYNNLAYLREDYKDYVYAHVLVNSETGMIFDVNPLFDKAENLRMFCLCDMTQALGNIRINIKDYNVNMATFSLHKIGGPKGLGIVYINQDKNRTIKPLIYGSQENGLRGGTQNVPYISVAGSLVMKAQNEVEEKQEHCRKLSILALDMLSQSGVEYFLNRSTNNITSTLNFALKGIESEVIQSMLSQEGIYIGVGSACTSGLLEEDPIMRALNVPDEFSRGQIRLSFKKQTQERDVEIAMEHLIKYYKELV